MKVIEEKFRLDDLSGYIYFLNYDIIYGYPVEIYKIEEDGSKIPITILEYPDLPLSPNTISIDYDRNLLFLSDNFYEGDEFIIKYYTSGRENPFKITKDLYLETMKLIKKLNHRIVDGLYFYNLPHDNEYVVRLSRGSIIFNGLYMAVDEIIIDFKKIPLPTVMNKYVCHLIYISQDTISSYFDLQRYTLRNVDIISSYMYSDKKTAITEVNNKLFNDMDYDFDTVIIVGYILTTFTPDGRFEKWYMYRDSYRTF